MVLRDFEMFRYLYQSLGGKSFATDDEIKEAVQEWLFSLAEDIYDLGTQKLIEHYEKYGNYVEK